MQELARTHRPKAIVCGSISYPRHPEYSVFREIADEVGAYLIADAAHPIGLVAGGAAPSPVPYADIVCATTHKVLRGPRGGMVLCGAEFAERIDRAVFPFTQGGAQMHTIAAKAVAFGEAAAPAFTTYAHRVVANARALADELAAHGFAVTTGGTDTHLITADPAPSASTARSPVAGSPPPASCWTPASFRTGTSAGSGSARPPSPPRACGSPRWPGSPSCSPQYCAARGRVSAQKWPS